MENNIGDKVTKVIKNSTYGAQINSAPGLSCEIVGFTYEGFVYNWSEERECYYSNISDKIYLNVPIGAYNLKWSR